jgi:hypothetical protein
MTSIRAIKSTPSPPPPEAPPDNRSLYDRIISDSTLTSAAAKETLARAVVLLSESINELRRKQKSGQITAEEVRAIPAIVSNIKRTFEALGLIQHDDPEDAEDIF